MTSYTIEDIEMLRKKSGMTYQEAVALLDYHDGNLAYALIDLEKSGRLKEEPKMENAGNTYAGTSSDKRRNVKEKTLRILQKLYLSRVKVQKGKILIVNFSVLFGMLCLILAPHLTVFGFILSLILGYRFTFTKLDEDFATDNLEKIVRNAAQTAKNSVSNVIQSLSEKKSSCEIKESDIITDKENKSTYSDMKSKHSEDEEDNPADALRKQSKEIEETMDSFFACNPAATSYHNSYSAAASEVPTIRIPVHPETKDDNAEINNNQDGFSSVTAG